jgi:hypothetical protein
MQRIKSQPTFRRNISPPSSGSKNKPSKKPAWKLVASTTTLVSCSPYSLTLKMEAICSSETLVDFQQTTFHYIPEDNTLHNHAARTSNPTNIIIVYKNCFNWSPPAFKNISQHINKFCDIFGSSEASNSPYTYGITPPLLHCVMINIVLKVPSPCSQ